MKRLTTDHMLRVEGGCFFCMPGAPNPGAVPKPLRVMAHLLRTLFH